MNKDYLKIDRLILTCEHGGNEVPEPYTDLFLGHQALLQSHRGWDPGALELAESLATALNAPLYASVTSRLLVDLNRSLHNRTLFSAITRPLQEKEKRNILREHYFPFRNAVENALAKIIDDGITALHLSVHSFTPVLNQDFRKTDLGILYDPSRRAEKQLALRWQNVLSQLGPGIRIRRNYPYRGTADGFTTFLRERFPEERYTGMELEVNQQYPLRERRKWQYICKLIARSLRPVCGR